MSLITDAIDRLLQPLFDKIKAVFAPFGKAFNLVGRFWSNLTSIGQRTRDLISEILAEIDAWKNFRESLSFRTKLVSIPGALNHIQDFIGEIKTAWSSILDIIKQIRGKFEATGNPTEEAEEAISDIENSGFRGILEKFPKLFKGLEKILGFLALLLDALETISAGLDDLKSIVDVLRDIREDVETGGPLFLSQKNPRRTAHLDTGEKIVLRVGNLHS